MTKLTKNTFRLVTLVMLVVAMPLVADGQKPSRKVTKAQKKAEKVDDQQKKAYQKARKKEIKRRYNMQTPETKARMKQTRKEAKQNNKVRKEPFLKRVSMSVKDLFKKKKPKKNKRRRR